MNNKQYDVINTFGKDLDIEKIKSLEKNHPYISDKLILDLVNGDFRTNINLFELGDALSNVIVKPNKITPKVGYARNKNLNIALKTTKNIDLKYMPNQ